MRDFLRSPAAHAALALAALVTMAAPLAGRADEANPRTTRPPAYYEAQPLVRPSSFHGVHGLAIDAQGRLLAGSVVGNAIWEVDRLNGAARVLIDAPEGQADDIAVGPQGELAWTNYLMGMLRYRASDSAPIQILAKDLPGLNSVDFDRRNGKLYASQVFLGDALYEIDRAGKLPPRLIAKDLGGFNGFEVGPDGMLYGPLWFKGQVVRINPADGAVTVIADGFKIPAAANLDGKGNLWVVDARSGELVRVVLATGAKTVEAQLKSSLDNLAIAPDGVIYVSNMANNSIESFDPATRRLRTITRGDVAVSAGLKVDGGKLFLADVFAFREIDRATGAVTDIFRMQADPALEYPFSVGLSSRRYALTSWFTGTVQIVDRASRRTEHTIHHLKAPYDALPLEDGSVVYAEIATGSITRASGPEFAERKVLATGLQGPVQMVVGPQMDALYVSEAAGRIVRVPLSGGTAQEVAKDLAQPEGLAFTPWGSLVVAEVGKQRLTEIDLASGQRRTIAHNLPIGLAGGPGMPPPYVPTGVAVASDGTVYVSADLVNAIYRAKPRD